MTSKNITLDLYLEADEDKRLGLFLFHRDLRDEFTRIEMAETEAVADQKGSQSSKPGLRRLAATLWALIKVKDYPATGENRSITQGE